MSDNEEIMFSVELTTYNQKKYIAQTLQSIIDQEHNYKYEILVSDDCSTDGTQDVIKEFQKKYPDVVKPVYNEKNIGAMANYYATVARAKGKYLMGCGGDDYWLPGKVQKQIEFMEQNPGIGFCYSRAKICKEDIKENDGFVGCFFNDKNDILLKHNCIPALTTCVRMDLFKKYLNEIQPENKDWLMEDYPLNIYCFYESYIYYFSEPLGVYRVINDSLCHQVNPKKQFIFEKSVYEIRKFFANKYDIVVNELSNYDLYAKVRNLSSIDKNKLKSLRKELGLSKNNEYFLLIKRIIKNILPYGIVVFMRRIKRRYTKLNSNQKLSFNNDILEF